MRTVAARTRAGRGRRRRRRRAVARDSGGFARICDMEPGMRFRERPRREAFTFAGIDPVESVRRREFVRVLTVEGASWICDKYERFPLVTDEKED
jgi:hypothetical protein